LLCLIDFFSNVFWWTIEKLNFFVIQYLNHTALQRGKSIPSAALQIESGCKIPCIGQEMSLGCLCGLGRGD